MNYAITDADLERMKLFVLELRQLQNHMLRNRHPDVERLEHLLDRFLAPTNDDRLSTTLRHG